MTEIYDVTKLNEKIVLCMGFFDCVHIGHRTLIEKAEAIAKKRGLKVAIMTFSNNPYKTFNSSSKLVYTYSERKEIFESLRIDYVLPFRFDSELKNMSREDFFASLIKSGQIAALVCGYDYLFGFGGAGDSDFLTVQCKKNNIELNVVSPVELCGKRVSTTAIKDFLLGGDIISANRYLGESYKMCGEVVRGRGEGAKYAVATANLKYSQDKLLPGDGVYATITEVNGKLRKSVTNVGQKPTFSDITVSVETHIAGEENELYDKYIRIEFIKRLRDIVKFDSPDELKKQISNDINWL